MAVNDWRRSGELVVLARRGRWRHTVNTSVTGVTNRDASGLLCHVTALLSTTTTWRTTKPDTSVRYAIIRALPRGYLYSGALLLVRVLHIVVKKKQKNSTFSK